MSRVVIYDAVKRRKGYIYWIDYFGNLCCARNPAKEKRNKKVHLIDSRNYYLCNQAVGNGLRGMATKNIKLATCKNCIQRGKNVKKKS